MSSTPIIARVEVELRYGPPRRGVVEPRTYELRRRESLVPPGEYRVRWYDYLTHRIWQFAPAYVILDRMLFGLANAGVETWTAYAANPVTGSSLFMAPGLPIEVRVQLVALEIFHQPSVDAYRLERAVDNL